MMMIMSIADKENVVFRMIELEKLLRDKKICKDCKEFLKKFKEWDDDLVPKVVMIASYECKECGTMYDICGDMCRAWIIEKDDNRFK